MTAADEQPGVGVYGGTFNPIHLGHLRAAEEVADELGLERVLFVPSARPPHKKHRTAAGSEDFIAPAHLRLAWTRLAIEGNPRFEVDPIEVERDGPSYLVDTLREIGRRIAPARPIFILGRDAFMEMDGWKDPETIFSIADFAVTTRPPVRPQTLEDWLPETARDAFELAPDRRSGRHRRAGTWIRMIEISALDVSASRLRALAHAGRSLRYLVPEAALGSILESGVYSASAGDARRES